MYNSGSIKVKTAPTTNCISVEQLKAHLRVDFSDEDTLIADIIAAAELFVQKQSGRYLMPQTVIQANDDWQDGYIELRGFPFREMTAITYTDADGNAQALSSQDYYVNDIRQPALIQVHTTLPVLQNRVGVVRIEYQVGYTNASDVPANIKQAILHLAADMYERREARVLEKDTTVEYLLNFDRYREL